MASEKKPSIYSDRGSIGSAKELDEYGVWVKSEPQVLSSAGSDDQKSNDFSMPDFDVTASDENLQIADAGDFDSSGFDDIELPENNFDIESAEENIDTNFEDFSVSDDAALAGVPEDDFEVPTVEAIEASSQNKENDLSTQLLLKIANELSSIRSELSDLKKEFSIIRTASPEEEKGGHEQHGGFFAEEDDETIALTGDEMDNILTKEDEQHGGFFTEEDDETIALTGDELDNILNTADFTEESGANEKPEEPLAEIPSIDAESFDDVNLSEEAGIDTEAETDASEEEVVSNENEEELIQIDFDALGIDLNPDVLLAGEADAPVTDEQAMEDLSSADMTMEAPEEMPDTEASETAIDEIDSDFAVLSASEEKLLSGEDLEAHEHEELKKLRDEGAKPINPAPENSSYLEESEIAEFSEDVSFDSSSFDLSEAIIDDPELTADGIDDAVTEPVIEEMVDIGIDMDSLEDLTITDDDEETEDINFDEPAEDNIAEDNIDDASMPDLSIEPPAEEESIDTDTPLTDGSLDIDALSDSDFDIDVSMPDENLEIETSSDDLDIEISIPQDDLNVDTPADDDLNMEVSLDDDLDIDVSTPEENLDEVSSDDNFDIELTMPDDNFDDVPAAEELDIDETTDDDLDIELSMPDVNLDDDVPEAEELDIDETADDDFDIELSMPDDNFDDVPVAEELDIDETADDSIEEVIPEGLEEEIEETLVPFDDDLEEEIPDDLPILPAADKTSDNESFYTPPPAAAREERPQPKAGKERTAETAPLRAPASGAAKNGFEIPSALKTELKTVLSYMDQLLESLPEEKIEEFAKSEYFDSYKKLFKELGLV